MTSESTPAVTDGVAVDPTPVPRTHFAGFEGLRAMASLMVVVHHASSLAGDVRSPAVVHRTAAVLDGGVAIFFVISGFLIYRPFVQAHLEGRRPMRTAAFLWRRLLRLVPAYWLALTCFWAIGSFSLGADWWRYYLFLQVYSRATTFGGIVPAWSLCVEVTFYLMVPVLAGGLVRLVGRTGRSHRSVALVHLAACAALFAGAIGARAVISRRDPSWRGLSFQWLPTNLDLFATGMALAVLSAWAVHHAPLRSTLDRLARTAEWWWLAAFALLAWYAANVGGQTFEEGYRGWIWDRRQLLLALTSALLLLPIVFGPADRGLVRKVLGNRVVAWLGTVSFGIYLWHQDWMERVVENRNAISGLVWDGWAGTPPGDSNLLLVLAVGGGLGVLCAAISWYGLERPLARFKGVVRSR